ncbi:uncharacterized protein LOC128865939 isoform X2 [Anastrepha ludens]|uniref:uncharacterized protein LOC128865939 isoform X2 n=1 Tax=Anastrepha ludens TaxID=28586 RepID=UPI0023AE8EB7|nr:uncharacterized protein LOC128865939 isoform X2 [Anastrepha ludens]
MALRRSLEESDLALIARVKMTPSLYDQRNPDFRLAYRKEQEWETVGAMVGMSAVEARRRWTCLRDRYSRELKQLRLHPEKEEYVKNSFFRQMDFLRRYIRRRRSRRRNGFMEYENKGGDEQKSKIEHIIQLQNKAEVTEEEEEEDYCLENYNDGETNSYPSKIDENTLESEDFPEFVDGEVYEECVETPVSERNIKSQPLSPASIDVSANQLNCTITPTVLPQHNPNGAVYTISTRQAYQHQSSSADIATVPQHKQSQHLHTNAQPCSQQSQIQSQLHPNASGNVRVVETEDDLFGKSIAVYLKQLSRRHKIKAQVEMFQILEKYIELEESANVATSNKINWNNHLNK